ncbi:DUF1947 domain-containing protein [Candidatus Woesearchaeota archaeon]|nr:DUF1947 domain-containing protein [Candidatus Woesearchaeota archaeon]
MTRLHLSNKDVRTLSDDAKGRYGIDLDRKARVERISTKKGDILLVNGKPWFFLREEAPIPTLRFLLERQILPEIAVDMPAVKFITNGADIMRPGIRRIDPAVTKDAPVCIVDETHRKPLAVGIALFPAEEMQALQQGKAVKNLHWVGDELWLSLQ